MYLSGTKTHDREAARGQQQVLAHAERPEDAAALGHDGHAPLGDRVRRLAAERGALEDDLAAAGLAAGCAGNAVLGGAGKELASGGRGRTRGQTEL